MRMERINRTIKDKEEESCGEMLVFALATALLIIAFQVATPGAALANLVSNGGFENYTDNRLQTFAVTNWTGSGEWGYGLSYITDGHSGGGGGKSFAVYSDVASTGLAQTLATVKDQSYEVGFWVYGGAYDGTPSTFSVQLGTNGLSFERDSHVDEWQYMGFVTTAKGNDTLTFDMFSKDGELRLTDVSVNPVPIPGAMFLFAPGLAGLAVLRRKLR
jgi:hypothetical protein